MHDFFLGGHPGKAKAGSRGKRGLPAILATSLPIEQNNRAKQSSKT